jgi:hypothetical protein
MRKCSVNFPFSVNCPVLGTVLLSHQSLVLRWGGKAGDFQILGFYAYLWQEPAGEVQGTSQDDAQKMASKAEGSICRISAAHARSGARTGCLSTIGHHGTGQILRRAHELCFCGVSTTMRRLNVAEFLDYLRWVSLRRN